MDEGHALRDDDELLERNGRSQASCLGADDPSTFPCYYHIQSDVKLPKLRGIGAFVIPVLPIWQQQPGPTCRSFAYAGRHEA
jgi:hypothetical protein